MSLFFFRGLRHEAAIECCEASSQDLRSWCLPKLRPLDDGALMVIHRETFREGIEP